MCNIKFSKNIQNKNSQKNSEITLIPIEFPLVEKLQNVNIYKLENYNSTKSNILNFSNCNNYYNMNNLKSTIYATTPDTKSTLQLHNQLNNYNFDCNNKLELISSNMFQNNNYYQNNVNNENFNPNNYNFKFNK